MGSGGIVAQGTASVCTAPCLLPWCNDRVEVKAGRGRPKKFSTPACRSAFTVLAYRIGAAVLTVGRVPAHFADLTGKVPVHPADVQRIVRAAERLKAADPSAWKDGAR